MLRCLKAFRSDLPNVILVIVFVVVNAASFVADYNYYLTAAEFYYLRLILGHSLPLARASALCLKLNSAIVLIPVCRNLLSVFRSCFVHCPEPFGRSSRRLLDSHVIHHKWTARCILFFTFLHVGAHVVNLERLVGARESANATLMALSRFPDQFPEVRSDGFLSPIRNDQAPFVVMLTTTAGVTGVVSTLALILIWTSSFRIVRIYAFESFWAVHHLFILFFLGLAFHGMGGFLSHQSNVQDHDPAYCIQRISKWGEDQKCPWPRFEAAPATAWMWIVGPIGLYVLERVVKIIRTRHPYRTSQIVFHPSKVLELQLRPTVGEKMFVSPGQYVALQIPAVSRLEWHPFTVTSAPDDDHISVHVRNVGDWTNALFRRCSSVDTADANTAIAVENAPIVYVDGPFGAASEEWFSYESAVFVGAGIGVTPFASVLKHLYHKRRQRQYLYVKRVDFFWIAPDMKAFEWFRDLLHNLEDGEGTMDSSNLLTYHIYLTRGWDPKRAASIARRDAEGDYDQFSRLRHRTEFGRPNWERELSEILDRETTGSRIGVFLCGPKPLAEEIKVACKRTNEAAQNGARLYFNKEHF